MAEYSVNKAAVTHARKLIREGKVVLKSQWGDVNPSAEQENDYLKSHSWSEYGSWHLALVDDASKQTKGRYGFGFGDFDKVHRSGLLACQYRAAEWKHREIEDAATKLLRYLDDQSESLIDNRQSSLQDGGGVGDGIGVVGGDDDDRPGGRPLVQQTHDPSPVACVKSLRWVRRRG